MVSVAVRIPRETHAEMNDFAKERHQTVGDIVAALWEDHERDQFWEEYQRAAIEARNNPEIWEQMQEEQREFDGMLMSVQE